MNPNRRVEDALVPEKVRREVARPATNREISQGAGGDQHDRAELSCCCQQSNAIKIFASDELRRLLSLRSILSS
jgi:hypothetical protein